MSDTLLVTKRDGRLEPFTFDKVHTVLFWATENIAAVSVSEIEIKTQMQLYNKITTAEIHEALIKSAADLISEETPNYQYVAARLAIFTLRKQVYGCFEPPTVREHVQVCIEQKVYDKSILKHYTNGDWKRIEKIVKHDRDFLLSYAAVEQFRGKYIVQDRTTHTYYETPQMAYIMIALTLFRKYTKETRMQYVRDYYDAISKGTKSTLTLPTPILAGVRTPTRQFSSCFPVGQLVHLKNEIKPIEEIRCGDEVLTESGSYNPVFATRKKQYDGEKLISLRTSFSIPYEFTSTEDHLVRAIPKKSESIKNYSTINWIRSDELTNGDFVHIPFNKDITHISHILLNEYLELPKEYTLNQGTICKQTIDSRRRSGEYDNKCHPINNKINLTADFMRFLGYFLAEGHIEKSNNSLSFTLNAKEDYIVNDIINISQLEFGLTPIINYNDRDNSVKVRIFSLPLKLLMMDLCGTGFNKKIINQLIMKLSPIVQRQLLIGVIRGDGCIHTTGMTLGLSNENLIYQLSKIFLRCGLYPSINKRTAENINHYKQHKNYKKDIITKHDSYLITMGRSGNYEFLISVGKNAEKIKPPKYNTPKYSKYMNGEYFAKIMEIKTIDDSGMDVYDLQVENEHSFVVSGICVHNCVLIETGDSLDSINETASSIADYASLRAGIGINAGKIRAKGSAVRGGEVFHTGNIPYYKYFLGALKSCSQGGIRGASATLYFPIWHLEAQDLIVLKNNKGTEETRVRHMDYGVQINGYLYGRLIRNEKITLFSPHDVPDLYNAFFDDQKLFGELYEKYERAYSVKKITVPALELISNVLIERNNTGRIYIQNVDHSNTHSSFNPDTSPVHMSNLCVEITLPTAELTRRSRIPFIKEELKKFEFTTPDEFRDEYGEIALCTLSSINLGAIQEPSDFEKPCALAVRALDELLDYQDYPMIAAGVPANKRRSLGIGLCNLAYFIAKHDKKYSDRSANDLVNEYAEAMSYYLIKASMELAKEKGVCDWFDETKYSKGIFPIHTYKKEVDGVIKGKKSYMNWNSLIADVKKHGMRNSTVMALMPVESSSQVINATNGIEPPRSPVSVKQSKDGILKQVVPEMRGLKNKYEYLWDMPHTRGYLEIAAIFQKWTDQAISTNTSYNPENYEGNKVPMSELIKDVVYAYKLGIKTLYYNQTYDGAGEVYNEEDEDCMACKL